MTRGELDSLNKIFTQYLHVKKMFRKKDTHDSVKKQENAEFQKLLDDFNINQDVFVIRIQGNSLSIMEKEFA
jgi:hypothetical protein